jgi:hypothetical protein
VGQAAVGEADRFESDHTHVKQKPKATIAAWLWKYYEYGLPDTPGRLATGIVEHLQAQGFVILDQEDPAGAKDRESSRGVTNDGNREGNQ